jgi:DNA-directed RNA polymerase subunit RPC12/RpoP
MELSIPHLQPRGASVISIACRCGADFHLADDLAGRKFRCTKCGELILAPPKISRRRGGSSPLLLTAGRTIEGRMDREDSAAFYSELWVQPVKYIGGGVLALAFAAAWYLVMGQLRPAGPVSRSAGLTAALTSVPLTWVVVGAFGVLGAVLFGMAVASYIALRNEMLGDD